MYDLIAISIPIVLIIAIAVSIRIISQAGVYKRLTETQTDPEVVRAILENGRKQRERSATIWAVMLLSTGLALVLIGLLRLGSEDPLVYGLLLLGAGTGMAVAVTLGRKMG